MISREEVEHVARLARLHFDEDELARLQPELATDHRLRASSCRSWTSPAWSPPRTPWRSRTCLRPDEPVAGLTQEEAMGNGPDVERGQFVVPRIG